MKQALLPVFLAGMMVLSGCTAAPAVGSEGVVSKICTRTAGFLPLAKSLDAPKECLNYKAEVGSVPSDKVDGIMNQCSNYMNGWVNDGDRVKVLENSGEYSKVEVLQGNSKGMQGYIGTACIATGQ